MKQCYLILENGEIFAGQAFGYEGETLGELVFATSMEGYMETLTDPSYYGQIVMQTFPLIGNYGVIKEDAESRKSFVKGYVVREWCQMPSNFRSQGNLDAYLKEQKIVGICGIDTRQLTRMIRDKGVMNARIVSQVTPEKMLGIREYQVEQALEHVSCKKRQTFLADPEKFRVALLDYGAKYNIIRELVKRGCSVEVLPYDVSAEEVLALKPDGIMLSNGPGDPKENTKCIATLKGLFGKLPLFGICLGHQLLALAAGADTFKLKYGHRGANQPVRRLQDGRTFISSQNHGYAVSEESLPKGAEICFRNANDGTIEGLAYPGKQAFSVQFHPEACGGPKDTEFLFEDFIAMMKG